MRVALDATAIPHRRAGAGNYIFKLLEALAAVDRENEYVFFAKRAHVEELDIEQPNVRLVPVDHPSRPLRLLWEQSVLPYRLRRLEVEVLHSPHYTMPLRKACRSVVTIPDMTFELLPSMHGLPKRLFFRAMMRWSARHADRLIAISESTRSDVVRILGVPPDHVVAIPLAADPAFRPMPPALVAPVCAGLGIVPGRYVCYVGVLEPRKNLPLLVQAYGALPRGLQDMPLVIAGKQGWMYQEILERVTALGLRDRVIFTGYVPQDHLPALYNGARVVVYPSVYEGFGLPVLEAMQCGAPVVTTRSSSLPEVAGDGALLVDPRDEAGLTAALATLMTDDALAADLSRRALRQAGRFSWERCARETLAVYRSVGGPSAGAGGQAGRRSGPA
jgi:glycosyltransferase involved in cell wall biosynthesis